MINTVTIAGYLGRDPDSQVTEDGRAIALFTVAVNEIYGQGDDQKKLTHWVDCISFGKIAEVIETYLMKGSKVTVSGRIRQNKWESSDGRKNSKLVVIVEQLEFMSRKDSETQVVKPDEADDSYPSVEDAA
jgi:single-strand DNA-binding protein